MTALLSAPWPDARIVRVELIRSDSGGRCAREINAALRIVTLAWFDVFLRTVIERVGQFKEQPCA